MMKMKRPTVVFLFLVLVVGFIVPDQATAEKRTMTIRRATGPIYTDGNLTEKDWVNASTIGDYYFPWWEKGERERTEAKLLWDDEYLYLALFVHDKHISAEYFQRNKPVSRDDCVEAFICPDTTKVRQYMNFEVNVLGTLLCRINPLSGPRPTWEPPGVQIGRSHKGTINNETDDDEWWIIEMAIPFTSFTIFGITEAPKDGDVWNINLYRIGGKVNPQRSCFNDISPEVSFHSPEMFGRAVFSAKTWPDK